MNKYKTNYTEISKDIPKAARLIKKGKVISFPTETVYGLGADLFNEKAVKEIFRLKGRAQDNPLIAHISNKKDIYKIAREVPDIVHPIINKFWPGPLTIVLKKKKIVPKTPTAGLDTIAIRMPSNKMALELIKLSRTPIVAPSANISGSPSGTTAKHVFDDFNERIPMILDGGKCKIGFESTVLDLTSKVPTILRPGFITESDLRELIKNISENKSKNIKKAKSPGMKYKHYSPKARVILFKNYNNLKIDANMKNAFIFYNNFDFPKNKLIKNYNRNLLKFGKDLFYNFRYFDKLNIGNIYVERVPTIGIGKAIMNRLIKASRKK